MKCPSRQHCEREELQQRIAELEAQEMGFIQSLCGQSEDIGRLKQRIEALEAERDLIAKYLHDDPPFDECAGICIHTRASEYAGEVMAAPTPIDYYMAFLDCCKAALLPGGE